MNTQNKVQRQLESQGLDVMVFEDNSPDNTVYDDGCVHVTRNGYRYAVACEETASYSKMDKLEKKYTKLVDKVLAQYDEK